MKRNHDKGDKIKDLLERGINEGVYPGAVLLVAKDGHIVFFQEVGYLSLIPEYIPMEKDTVFDLASLTKPLATTLALMKLVDKGQVGLDQPLSEIITTSPLLDKKDLTPRLLLCHSGGFADWKPFYLDLVKQRLNARKKILREWLLEEPLSYEQGTRSVYSDLGFIILEWLIEEITGISMSLYLERALYHPFSLERTFLGPGSSPKSFEKGMFAATEDCPWRKKVIQGEVHDENAFALGGYSGHAGLFGVAEDVYRIVNLLREHYQGKRDDYFQPETIREFFTKQEMVEGCTWALGWDTPSHQNSSSGKYFSPNSVGHLGFTGTSIWMDLEADVMAILLTNRIHPTRNNKRIKAFRPEIHDLIMEELGHA
ncbi:MAG: serine hydrolase [Deltaproteobacteria bacterium]|nr:serine hydrolase [Deltaproteobacteria bacterium]